MKSLILQWKFKIKIKVVALPLLFMKWKHNFHLQCIYIIMNYPLVDVTAVTASGVLLRGSLAAYICN